MCEGTNQLSQATKGREYRSSNLNLHINLFLSNFIILDKLWLTKNKLWVDKKRAMWRVNCQRFSYKKYWKSAKISKLFSIIFTMFIKIFNKLQFKFWTFLCFLNKHTFYTFDLFCIQKIYFIIKLLTFPILNYLFRFFLFFIDRILCPTLTEANHIAVL